MVSEANMPDESDSAEPGELAATLAAHGIALTPDQVEVLDRYRAILWRWNERLNLTRHTTLEKFVSRDVVDSLALAEHISRGRRVLDIGSGGGAPGLIIAICRPDLRVTLCESTQKKARFLHSAVDELGLQLEVFAVRAEELLELRTFDTLVARAVAPTWKLLSWLAPYWSEFEELLLVKGSSWEQERGEARHRGLLKQIEFRRIASYPMPGDPPGESVVLRIRRRRAGETEDP
ncbi:MAG: 16S rRNA (guanine(527)-N(7))-methyltransferase RsmG [Planctomycetota bacterium]|nr:MAG: 16S rRNA (guanine(527)-N(7))-methyltransferase RsmG [Planctomycetota bacterium]